MKTAVPRLGVDQFMDAEWRYSSNEQIIAINGKSRVCVCQPRVELEHRPRARARYQYVPQKSQHAAGASYRLLISVHMI
jgi:hypothetical protein